ncbi:MAG: hypothetical protein ABII09_09620 [Planctomycetota bacterium]
MHYGGDLSVMRVGTKAEIDLELLTSVTPFVLAMDENMVVTWASRAVLKRAQEAIGMNVTELIESRDPPEKISSRLIAEKIGKIRKLTLFQGKSGIPLIGRWLSCHDGFLLLATPDAKTSEDLSFFSFDDFPQESRLVELLVGRDETRVSLKEAASAASALKDRNRELEGAKQQLESANATLENEITERKKAEQEISTKMKEIEEFNCLAVGRELKMIELKREINRLLAERGIEQIYEIVE